MAMNTRQLLGVIKGLRKLGVSEFAYHEPGEVQWVLKFDPPMVNVVASPEAVPAPEAVPPDVQEQLKAEVAKIMNEEPSGDPMDDAATFGRQGLPSFRKYGDGTEQ